MKKLSVFVISIFLPFLVQCMDVESGSEWGETTFTGTLNDGDDLAAVLTNSCFYPLHKKGKNFLDNVNGWLPNFANYAVNDATQKTLTTVGDEVIKKWTTYVEGLSLQFYTKINILLATDAVKGDDAFYARELKSLIGWQTPKWEGKSYRGALHSPLEIFLMMHQELFFLPTFVATSTNFRTKTYQPHPTSGGELPKTARQNLVFEIDNTEFSNFSTLIQAPKQSSFDERESLMSCYNIYKVEGFRLVKGPNGTSIPVLSLKVKNYELLRDLENHTIKAQNKPLPREWLESLKPQFKNRNMSPAEFVANLKLLITSFNMYCLTHKNGDHTAVLPDINVDDIFDAPTEESGIIIDKAKYDANVMKQKSEQALQK